MLYDGLATSWQPALNESSGKTKDSPEWVEIEFSSKQVCDRQPLHAQPLHTQLLGRVPWHAPAPCMHTTCPIVS